MDKKGQGISINVIIIAVLALVVLVVLVAIFTGRIALFEKGVSKEASAKLISLKVQYGDCHPTAAQETSFKNEFAQAESDAAKQAAEDTLMAEINRCELSSDKSGCESAGCKWS